MAESPRGWGDVERGRIRVMCEECGERPATVYVTKVIHGKRSEARLCTQCALERGEIGPLMQSPGWLLEQFLATLGGSTTHGNAGAEQGTTSPPGELKGAQSRAGGRHSSLHREEAPVAFPRRCPNCGLEYAEFARTGLLGCSTCYTTFRAPLSPALRRLHGAASHLGARPAHAEVEPDERGAAADRLAAADATHAPNVADAANSNPDKVAAAADPVMADLKQQLRKAVQDERFEDAARLRDAIHEMEV